MMEIETEERGSTCQVCKKKASISCDACESVWYCSSYHQKVHWNEHKDSCCLTEVRDDPDPELGKGTFALQDIKAGTLLFEECPVVSAADVLSEGSQCLACGSSSRAKEMKWKRCSTCTWPICSEDCEKNPCHARNECEVFSTETLTFRPPFEPDYCVVLIRMCLIKQRNPSMYSKILNLQSDYVLPMKDEFADVVEITKFWERLLSFFESISVDLDELLRLRRIFIINYMWGPSKKCAGGFEQVLYIKVSRINNSCAPNATWIISNSPVFTIRIVTATDVKAGDAITIEFHGLMKMGTYDRQRSFQARGYKCKCERCLDPTENGTYMSAIKCYECLRGGGNSVGYFLPETPTNISKTARWRCERCKSTKIDRVLVTGMDKLDDKITAIMKEYKSKKKTAASCMTAGQELSVQLSVYYHPDHWLFQEMTVTMCTFLMNGSFAEMEEKDCDMFLKFKKYLLAKTSKLSPGSSKQRAQIQHDLVSASIRKLQICHKKWKKHETDHFIDQLLKVLVEAMQFYKHEFPKTPDETTNKSYAWMLKNYKMFEKFRLAGGRLNFNYL